MKPVSRGCKSQLIELYVRSHTDDSVSIDTVCDELDMSLLTVVNIVNRLTKADIIERDGDALKTAD